MPNGVPGYRRYLLIKRQNAVTDCEDGLAITWEARQRAVAGTELPAGFPGKVALAEGNWVLTYEDLDQISIEELTEFYGLDWATAQAVLAALPEEFQAPTCADEES